ncbi:MAG: ABC transporter permease [Brachymonas sp.]|nr:ABC transporter permease [Brachymonas sp.]
MFLSHRRPAAVPYERRVAMSHQSLGSQKPLLLPPLIWQLVFFAAPLAFLLVISFWSVKNFQLEPAFTTKNWIYVLSRETFWSAYKYTWQLSLMAAFVSSMVAFPVAYSIAFHLKPRVRNIAIMLLVVPFFTAYLVRAYAWQVFLSDSGIINASLGAMGWPALPLLNNTFGSLIGYLTLCLPLVILIQVMGISSIDRSQIEAARNLRANPIQTLYEVIFPSMKTSLVVAWLFAFILSFGDFVSPTYLGGGASPTLSSLIIDTTKSGQQWPRAAVVAITMIFTLLCTSLLAGVLAYKRK